MREQLARYVDLLFAGSDGAEEIKQEILQNTLDRFDDLVARGSTEEAAYRQAIAGIGDVGEAVLRDRKHLAEDGMVVVVLPISAHDGYMLAEPEIITRGFIYVKESEELMNELKTVVMSAAEGVLGRRSRDIGELKGAIKSGVSNYLFKTTKRSPMVLPVITRL